MLHCTIVSDQFIAPHTTACGTKPIRSRAQERRRRTRPQLEPAQSPDLSRIQQAREAGTRQSRVSCGRSFGPGILAGRLQTRRPYDQKNDFTRTVGVVTYPEAMKEMLKEPGPSWSLFELVSS